MPVTANEPRDMAVLTEGLIMGEIVVKVSVRRWVFVPYKWGLVMMHKLTGLEPDYSKVNKFLHKYCIKVYK